VPRWWLPERWTFVAELPTTSVGKLDKKQIRASYRNHAYAVHELASESAD
jgi:fatty-acyl-CoA synthase